MVKFLKTIRKDDRGATAVEYGLIIALIFLAMIGGVQTFGERAIEMWDYVSARMAAAGNN
ncbi:Flp family type IVb pilin [Qipengyuania sp. 1NDH17]|uniref:Flp family type IVb pilin n=1 Tax=Qipengyuania polymorpha TaxID=2867234 RepID=A0ABS7J0Z0_9SPHN|nr:Flp family type IVb pilin [Qipengyuania polymorpha]